MSSRNSCISISDYEAVWGPRECLNFFDDSRLLLRKLHLRRIENIMLLTVVSSASLCQRLMQRVERLDKFIDPLAFELGAYDIEVNPKGA